ncbi:hypothetical protein JAO71_08470 [Olleya sp. YSTF-M6]|uniref:Histidyl-tRNA synthetase n=1 Tax=Olleya sediminilitoris TaxID=2795739 RepID=A0ABS1WL34_9FLAO|nr:DUF6495 family protein [Olleya sediminilitoris]MBL7559835.1 hypothetical protein [Olleya sediminilitoris]
MKYSRLTKEQFEELHQEFINFLATQSITAEEWATIKTKQPEVAEQELDVFSDLVWEGVLKSVKYVEQISAQNIHLFSFKEDHMHVIGIKIDGPIDVTTKDGFNWLRENLMDETVTFTQGKKDYSEDKNLDKFKLIQSGSAITKGELYEYMNTLIN